MSLNGSDDSSSCNITQVNFNVIVSIVTAHAQGTCMMDKPHNWRLKISMLIEIYWWENVSRGKW